MFVDLAMWVVGSVSGRGMVRAGRMTEFTFADTGLLMIPSNCAY